MRITPFFDRICVISLFEFHHPISQQKIWERIILWEVSLIVQLGAEIDELPLELEM